MKGSVTEFYIFFGAGCIICGVIGVLTAQANVDWQVRVFKIAPTGIRWYVVYQRCVGIVWICGGLFLISHAVLSD